MDTTISRQHRATDRPLSDPLHDDFQRAQFAQRIADTLIARHSPDSIVVGLYGKWGEGKSTVLNFIRGELSKANDKVAVLNFNPWRFTDETQLLINFFGELAKTIDKKMLTVKQRAAKATASYIAPLLPNLSMTLPHGASTSADFSKGLEALLSKAQPDADSLRERIETLLSESGKRVIIIIDDIDRLDKGQIQTIFRLVKLTADFRHTAYLLAFDDVMVARAIGEAFSATGPDEAAATVQQAGQSFLEKIIQVPLRLPRARTTDLLNFCFQRLDEVFKAAGIEPSEEEAQRIGNTLRAILTPRLTTPRLAVRYANAIEFSLPLLNQEVNTADFLLVEAMNVFYPELYYFVAAHEGQLTGSTQHPGGHYEFVAEAAQKKRTSVDELLEKYDKLDERQAAQQLLCTLFPRVSRHFNNSRSLFDDSPSNYSEAELARRQHIASSTHFGRYFAYTVLRDDVSDQEFVSFLTQPPAQQAQSADSLIARLGMSSFLQKLVYRTAELTNEQADSIWSLIIHISPTLSIERSSLFFGRTDLSQAAHLLLELLNRMPADGRVDHVLALINSHASFSLCEVLTEAILSKRQKAVNRLQQEEATETENPFSLDEWSKLEPMLSTALVDRALRDAGARPIYQVFPDIGCRIMHMYWRQAAGRPPLADYVRPFLLKNPLDIYQLLEACSPSVSSGGPFFRSSITDETVTMLTKSLGSLAYDTARQVLGSEAIVEYPGTMRPASMPSPENRLRQFVYLYEHRSTEPVATEGEDYED